MSGKHSKRNKKYKIRINKKGIMNIILLILIGIFIYSGYQVVVWIKSNIGLKKLEDELFTEVITEVEPTEENQEKTIDVDFEKLQEINPDIFAWIKLENTNINYPILQGETDEYYLRKDIYKKYSTAGSIFVDATTNKNFLDDNTVIYGHNLRNQKMFSDLTKVYNGELGNELYIEIYTKNTADKYRIFSVYITEPNLEVSIKHFTAEEKRKYIDDAIMKSKQPFNSQVDYEQGILTLITCDSTGKKRIIVNAIKQ